MRQVRVQSRADATAVTGELADPLFTELPLDADHARDGAQTNPICGSEGLHPGVQRHHCPESAWPQERDGESQVAATDRS